MADEKTMIKLLKANSIQLRQQQAQLNKLMERVCSLSRTSDGYCNVVPFGILDISTSQLVNAYDRGLSLPQLVALSNHKYTASQIRKKIIRAKGGNV